MGPTGVGKSSWALQFGKKLMQSSSVEGSRSVSGFGSAFGSGSSFGTIPRGEGDGPSYQVEIINCDSVQVYKKLKIGSAFPSEGDMADLPHHLYGYVGPERKTKFTVAQYRKDFFHCVRKRMDFHPPHRQLIFLVVGGTGFYFRAIEKGLYKVHSVPLELQKDLKKRAEQQGFQELHRELQTLDSEAGKRIHPNDHYRILRALELIHTEKKTLHQIQKESAKENAGKAFPYPLEKIFLDVPLPQRRESLRHRIEKMFQKGFALEVQQLLEEGLKDWSPLSSVGYKELSQFLLERKAVPNEMEQKELMEKILKAHSYLGKRQRTWFKKESACPCFLLPEEEKAAEKYVEQSIKKISCLR